MAYALNVSYRIPVSFPFALKFLPTVSKSNNLILNSTTGTENNASLNKCAPSFKIKIKKN